MLVVVVIVWAVVIVVIVELSYNCCSSRCCCSKTRSRLLTKCHASILVLYIHFLNLVMTEADSMITAKSNFYS